MTYSDGEKRDMANSALAGDEETSRRVDEADKEFPKACCLGFALLAGCLVLFLALAVIASALI